MHRRVASALDGKSAVDGQSGWDEARRAWQLSVDQRPAAVAYPESAQDVVGATRWARERGQRVAAQGTGHNAAPLGSLHDTLLLKTERMRGVSIDPRTRIARAEAGVLSLEVVQAAARHGLATPSGTSPDVGVVGYTIGGGIGLLGRAVRPGGEQCACDRARDRRRAARPSGPRAGARSVLGACAAVAAASAS